MADQQAECEPLGWNVCVLYASGREKVLWFCRSRETALRSIDLLYGYGYPLHVAYVLRQSTVSRDEHSLSASHPFANQLKLKAKTLHQAPAWYS